jgi:hypothetical protein
MSAQPYHSSDIVQVSPQPRKPEHSLVPKTNCIKTIQRPQQVTSVFAMHISAFLLVTSALAGIHCHLIVRDKDFCSAGPTNERCNPNTEAPCCSDPGTLWTCESCTTTAGHCDPTKHQGTWQVTLRNDCAQASDGSWSCSN